MDALKLKMNVLSCQIEQQKKAKISLQNENKKQIRGFEPAPSAWITQLHP